MHDLTNEYAQHHPYRSLGWKFWLPWGLGLTALLGTFPLALYLTQRLLQQPMRMIAMGVFVVLFTLVLIRLNMIPHNTLVKRGLQDPMRPAMRRYKWRFLAPMLLYVAALLAATWYWKTAQPAGLAAILTALAPAVPILFALRAMYLLPREETDEYLRGQMLEGWTLAALIAMAVCTVLGFLDQFKVIPHIPLWAALPIWAICMGPVHLLLKGRCA